MVTRVRIKLPVALLLAVLILFFGAPPLHAERVALLPLADLSRGTNGVSLPFTEEIGSALKKMGVDLVPGSDVVRFMARNRIRTSGVLDSFMIKKMGRELHCSLVVMGTVTEMGGEDPSLGLTLLVADSDVGTPIWAGTSATSLGEQVKAFGVGQPENVEDLTELVVGELLGDLEDKLAARIIPLNRFYQLLGMQVSPGHVRGASEIEGVLKIRFLDDHPARIAVESAAGKTYLYRDKRSDIYRGRWIAPYGDGEYPVSLALEWGQNRSVERVENVGFYQVMNEVSDLSMDVKQGVEVGEMIAFRDHLLILPRLAKTREMKRWQLEIKSENGGMLVKEDHEGNLPERLVWGGRDSQRNKLPNGTYEIVLHAWDHAGNHSVDARKVTLQSSALPVTVATFYEEGKTYLTVKSTDEKGFPLTSWTLNATSLQGDSLIKVDGSELPVILEVPPLEGEAAILFNFEGRDFLGNRLRMKKKEIALAADEEKPVQEKDADSWVSDF